VPSRARLRDDDILLCASAMDPPSRIDEADPAHLTRDFRAFAGNRPASFMRRYLPDGR